MSSCRKRAKIEGKITEVGYDIVESLIVFYLFNRDNGIQSNIDKLSMFLSQLKDRPHYVELMKWIFEDNGMRISYIQCVAACYEDIPLKSDYETYVWLKGIAKKICKDLRSVKQIDINNYLKDSL